MAGSLLQILTQRGHQLKVLLHDVLVKLPLTVCELCPLLQGEIDHHVLKCHRDLEEGGTGSPFSQPLLICTPEDKLIHGYWPWAAAPSFNSSLLWNPRCMGAMVGEAAGLAFLLVGFPLGQLMDHWGKQQDAR